MTSIEGHRGEPRPRPPFPAVSGLWGKPSVLNNVETFANIAPIILKGAEWYASTGTESSKGTKVFALGGNVQHTGLVEVPIGMQLGELIYEVGGGIPNGKAYKAAQLGGPSGGCIPKEHLNVPVDYATLQELGAIMGSGGVIVMDEDTCMVDIARFFLEFTQEESCGKCPPCRVGTKRMLEIVERICSGEGEEGDIERLIALGETISETALCGLGQTAPNPVLSTIRHFRHEYEAHIKDKYCEAGVCSTMFKARCSNACPASVNIPGFVSLVGEQRYDEALRLHRERNPLASICARVCFHPCESKCMRAEPRRRPRDPSRQALHGRAGEGAAAAGDPGERRERRPQGRRRRLRARRPLRGLLPRPAGLQAGRVRGRAQGRRHARPGHPGLPPAAPGARARSQDDRGHGRPLRVRQGARQGLHASRASRTRATRPCSWPSAPRRAPASASRARTARTCTTASPSSRSTTSAARARSARTSPSSAAATRPSTPPAPPCASAPRASRSSTAARARRCRRGARRSTPPTSRASTS